MPAPKDQGRARQTRETQCAVLFAMLVVVQAVRLLLHWLDEPGRKKAEAQIEAFIGQRRAEEEAMFFRKTGLQFRDPTPEEAEDWAKAQGAIDAFLDHVRAGRLQAAYEGTTNSFKRRLDKEPPGDLAVAGQALQQPHRCIIIATLRYPGGGMVSSLRSRPRGADGGNV